MALRAIGGLHYTLKPENLPAVRTVDEGLRAAGAVRIDAVDGDIVHPNIKPDDLAFFLSVGAVRDDGT